MHARFITLAVVIAAGAVIWTVPREPVDSGYTNDSDQLSASTAAQQPNDPANKAAGGQQLQPARAAPYTPGEIQRGLLELLALHEDGAPPDELLSLAEDIYLALLNAGPAAIAETLDFLASGHDLPLPGQPGGEFDFRSLRLALIDALRQIGGIEVERAFLAELHHTHSNAEVEALATALESLQPGVYREAIMDRALALLTELKSGTEANLETDSAPLFRILQEFGDEDVTAVLQKMPSWLDAYAEVALANLPKGQGLDVLDRLARRELRGSADSRSLHLLAQLAIAQQRAEAALFELALDGAIPDQSWPLIADILMGDRQLQLEEPPSDPLLVGSLRGTNPFAVHSISDRQVQSIYSVNYSAVLAPQAAAQRLALINRLLDEPLSPAARDALWAAIDLLNGHY